MFLLLGSIHMLNIHPHELPINTSSQFFGIGCLAASFFVVFFLQYQSDKKKALKKVQREYQKKAEESVKLFMGNSFSRISWEEFIDILVTFRKGGTVCPYSDLKELFSRVSYNSKGIAELVEVSVEKETLFYKGEEMTLLFSQINRLFENAYQDNEILKYVKTLHTFFENMKPYDKYKGYAYLKNNIYQECPFIKQKQFAYEHHYHTATFVS